MTDRSKGPETTQIELTSAELDGVSGGMMRNEPADVGGSGGGGSTGGDAGGGGGGTTTTAASTTADTMAKLQKAAASYSDMLNSISNIGR